jgi:uncharacterized protein
MPSPAPDSSPAIAVQDAVLEHREWHRKRLEALQAPDGWLTLVGLHFLADGTYSAGSSETADFSHVNCVAPIIGRFVVAGDVVRFVAEGDLAGSDAAEAAGVDHVGIMHSDENGPPSVVRSGPVSFALVRRNGRLALRVRDNHAETRVAFQCIELFPHDGRSQVEAAFTPAPPSTLVEITNVTGHTESQELAGTLKFHFNGVDAALRATKGAGGRLFVVFGDATNGRDTYGGGRFLDVPAPVDGRAILDFNRAYNPPCAFTAFATCPLPPATNRLPFPVAAGERAPKDR